MNNFIKLKKITKKYEKNKSHKVLISILDKVYKFIIIYLINKK